MSLSIKIKTKPDILVVKIRSSLNSRKNRIFDEILEHWLWKFGSRWKYFCVFNWIYIFYFLEIFFFESWNVHFLFIILIVYFRLTIWACIICSKWRICVARVVSEDESTGSDDTKGLQLTKASASDDGARSETHIKNCPISIKWWITMKKSEKI